MSDWFLTVTGKQFNPLKPDPRQVCIEDIAHALSHVCRYGGHCNPFYSVAQHSVHVSYLVPEGLAPLALMHDAPEAYCGDMVRPLKYQLPQYMEIEDRIWEAVATRFGLLQGKPTLNEDIKLADDRALMTERRDIMPKHNASWGVKAMPDPERIRPLGSEAAKHLFLNRYDELFNPVKV